jgi:FixJ family two-component response regulator
MEVGVANNPVIAIIDDDESVREAIMSLIKASGFAADTFPCAEDFLDSDRFQSTSCLIADVHMPGMSGLDLHDRLVAEGHRIPTILVTAYPNDALQGRAAKSGVICLLSKPFTEADLLSCMRRALEGNKAGGSSGN